MNNEEHARIKAMLESSEEFYEEKDHEKIDLISSFYSIGRESASKKFDMMKRKFEVANIRKEIVQTLDDVYQDQAENGNDNTCENIERLSSCVRKILEII